jgi:hypothetical protein
VSTSVWCAAWGRTALSGPLSHWIVVPAHLTPTPVRLLVLRVLLASSAHLPVGAFAQYAALAASVLAAPALSCCVLLARIRLYLGFQTLHSAWRVLWGHLVLLDLLPLNYAHLGRSLLRTGRSVVCSAAQVIISIRAALALASHASLERIIRMREAAAALRVQGMFTRIRTRCVKLLPLCLRTPFPAGAVPEATVASLEMRTPPVHPAIRADSRRIWGKPLAPIVSQAATVRPLAPLRR